MKAKELIRKLEDVCEINPDSNVYILDGEAGFYFDFSGFSVDDNNDVTLDILTGDEPA